MHRLIDMHCGLGRFSAPKANASRAVAVNGDECNEYRNTMSTNVQSSQIACLFIAYRLVSEALGAFYCSVYDNVPSSPAGTLSVSREGTHRQTRV